MPRPLFKSFPKQEEFVEKVFSGEFRYLMYGGAIKGGKTFVSLAVIILLCKMFPGSHWAIVRRDLPTLKRNTVPAFDKIRPTNFVGSINKSDWVAHCQNGSKIFFVPESIKDDPNLQKFHGFDVNGFLLEDADELSKKTWLKAVERAGSWVVPGLDDQPPVRILVTTNPADNWVREVFFNPWFKENLEAPYCYVSASPFDNPFNTQEYLESLKSLPNREYKKFVLGDWSIVDDPDQLIKFLWIKNAQDVKIIDGEKGLGVDVARYGNDKTALLIMRGNSLKEMKTFSNLSIDRTADIVQAWISRTKINADRVGIDSVGLGAGVVDILRKRGFEVKEVVAGAKPIKANIFDDDFYKTELKFKNLRSQMWYYLRERIRKNEIYIPRHNQKIAEDLSAIRYKISADRMIQIESKDELKKRIGRSPDLGDAFAMANIVSAFSSGSYYLPRAI